MNEMSMETLYSLGTGIKQIETPVAVSAESFDGSLDCLVADIRSAESMIDFIDTYDKIDAINTNTKVKMVKRLNANYGTKNKSLESYLMSVEADAVANTDAAPAGDEKIEEKKSSFFSKVKKAGKVVLNAIKQFFIKIWTFIKKIVAKITEFFKKHFGGKSESDPTPVPTAVAYSISSDYIYCLKDFNVNDKELMGYIKAAESIKKTYDTSLQGTKKGKAAAEALKKVDMNGLIDLLEESPTIDKSVIAKAKAAAKATNLDGKNAKELVAALKEITPTFEDEKINEILAKSYGTKVITKKDSKGEEKTNLNLKTIFGADTVGGVNKVMKRITTAESKYVSRLDGSVKGLTVIIDSLQKDVDTFESEIDRNDQLLKDKKIAYGAFNDVSTILQTGLKLMAKDLNGTSKLLSKINAYATQCVAALGSGKTKDDEKAERAKAEAKQKKEDQKKQSEANAERRKANAGRRVM